MALPESFIEELSRRNSIEDVVSSYVTLRARGRTRVGLCPFHGEKTPSFTVYPENNSFYCFGCGAGGDLITFVRKIEHLDYMDAVKFLADRAGMDMPRAEMDDTAAKLRRRVLEANREAARFFHEMLYTPQGATALNYYRSRGYSDRTIRRFGLGYAPNDFHALVNHLRSKGYRDEEMLLAWLARKSEKGYVYDSFRNRVMVPIIDVRGNVIAFGGRVLDDSKPKYINTGDTPVFKKTNNLFALNIAKDTGRRLILCEGYMDVIAMHQAGFTDAVAALGTSFTNDHANLIARYADEVILIFDADEAGQKGANRAMSMLRNTGVRVRVVRIPDGKDPDEYLRHHPPEALKLLIDRSSNDVEYRLSVMRQNFAPLDSSENKVGFLKEAVRLIAGLDGPVERDVYASKLAQELGVSKTAILQQIEDALKKTQRAKVKRRLREDVQRSEAVATRANPEALRHVRAATAEEALIGAMLRYPDRIAEVAERLPEAEVVTAFNRRLYAEIVSRFRQGALIELSVFSATYSADEMAYITSLVNAASSRSDSREDMLKYIDVIRTEYSLLGFGQAGTMSDEETRRMMEILRKMKQ